MNLQDLLLHVPHRVLGGPTDREVVAVSRDSRVANSEGWIFVAVVGEVVDGHRFAPVIEAGVVVVERPVDVPKGVTVIEVEDARAALGQLAAGLEGHPSRRLRVVGVTGTNGKTTITTVVQQALTILGHVTLRVGTTGIALGDQHVDLGFTTPEAPALQRWLRRSEGEGAFAALLEVSSIGLAQRRVEGVSFHTGVFTNLTPDHLDFHETMERYRDEKARLFRELLRDRGGPPRALLCRDDPNWDEMEAPNDRWTYGTHRDADFRVSEVRMDVSGMSFLLTAPTGRSTVRSTLIGHYNALNLVAAIGVLMTLGVGLEDASGAVGQVSGVPGRLERVDTGEGPAVFVDYDHSPDALQRVLETVRALTDGTLWVVFGCGGDRDRLKRPEMGRVARACADRLVVTTDNPRSESPMSIIEEVLEGFDGVRKGEVHVEPDRERAILWTLEHASRDDVVMIAGKGHETYQIIGTERHHFDDRETARNALATRAGVDPVSC